MKKKFLLAILAALAVSLPLGMATASADSGALALPMAFNQAIANAIPAPADSPLLDANGNVVTDASGAPVSDPNESFHSVKPQEYDPAHTDLVQAAWMNAIGCPTGATVATYPATSPTGTFTDTSCTVGDPKDRHNEGLLLVKTGPTSNNASAVAELKKVKGITLTELGWDIRKQGVSANAVGSHCGAGAPRFNISFHTATGPGFAFLGCNSPPAEIQTPSLTGWIRMRWGAAGLLAAGVPATNVVDRITIVFDEGQDTGGPDQFGAAVLDNIDVNGTLVGHGACDCD
jgi:hypothetical protein